MDDRTKSREKMVLSCFNSNKNLNWHLRRAWDRKPHLTTPAHTTRLHYLFSFLVFVRLRKAYLIPWIVFGFFLPAVVLTHPPVLPRLWKHPQSSRIRSLIVPMSGHFSATVFPLSYLPSLNGSTRSCCTNRYLAPSVSHSLHCFRLCLVMIVAYPSHKCNISLEREKCEQMSKFGFILTYINQEYVFSLKKVKFLPGPAAEKRAHKFLELRARMAHSWES